MNHRPLDIFCASIRRPEKLRAMIESVEATKYPARVCVAAGDQETIRTCEKYPELAECVYCSEANRRIGCTAPLNLVINSLVRHDALFCTDDCVFSPDALHIAMETLYREFPDGDGVVGLAQENIPQGYPLAFPLFGRAFIDRFNIYDTLFFPGYFHFYNDAEIGLTIKCMGNWVFEPRAKLFHAHPQFGGGEEDLTHSYAMTYKEHDYDVWCDRRYRGMLWGIDEGPEDVAAPALLTTSSANA